MSLQSEEGFMDREVYVNLSTRQQGTFAGRREIVYTLFEAYTKRRRERREWDAADRYICLPGLPCLFHDIVCWQDSNIASCIKRVRNPRSRSGFHVSEQHGHSCYF